MARVANPVPCVRLRGPATSPPRSADEEAGDPHHEADARDDRAVARLLPKQLHRHRCPGLARIPQAAPPRFVPGNVRVLGLELAVARPRTAGPGVPERHHPDPDHDEGDAERAHVPVPPPSSRPRIAACTTAAFAWPRVAFMTCPTRNPMACGLPARTSATAAGFAARTWSTTGPSASASEIWRSPSRATMASIGSPVATCASSTSRPDERLMD